MVKRRARSKMTPNSRNIPIEPYSNLMELVAQDGKFDAPKTRRFEMLHEQLAHAADLYCGDQPGSGVRPDLTDSDEAYSVFVKAARALSTSQGVNEIVKALSAELIALPQFHSAEEEEIPDFKRAHLDQLMMDPEVEAAMRDVELHGHAALVRHWYKLDVLEKIASTARGYDMVEQNESLPTNSTRLQGQQQWPMAPAAPPEAPPSPPPAQAFSPAAAAAAIPLLQESRQASVITTVAGQMPEVAEALPLPQSQSPPQEVAVSSEVTAASGGGQMSADKVWRLFFDTDPTLVKALLQIAIERGANVRYVVPAEPLYPAFGTCFTTLHGAAAYYDVEVARVLLDAGADPNARAGSGSSAGAGSTPLHWAASMVPPAHMLPIVELLLERGAKRDATNEAGKRPYNVVQDRLVNMAQADPKLMEVMVLLG